MRATKVFQFDRNKFLNSMPNRFAIIDAKKYRDFINRNIKTGVFIRFRHGWYQKVPSMFPLPTSKIEEGVYFKNHGLKW
jgi:hypothetical protein